MSYENKEYILQFFEGVHEKENRDELIEVYRKAKAFDESLKSFKELERLHEEVRKVSKRNQDKAEVYKEVLFQVIREMESNLGESGETYDNNRCIGVLLKI